MNDENGTVTTERDGHVLVMTVDREQKMNSFTPEMFDQLSGALGTLDRDADLWVGVLQFAGNHTSAGLDLPRFFGPGADARGTPDPDAIDAFGMHRRCSKPVVVAVQGLVLTIAIEMMLGCDIVVAADNCRFRQLEPKRGLAVFGGAHVRYVERAGWGNAMYHLLRADEFDADRALRLGLVQEVVPAGEQRERARSWRTRSANARRSPCRRSSAPPSSTSSRASRPPSTRFRGCANARSPRRMRTRA